MSTMTPIKTAFSLGLIAIVLIGTTCFEQELRLIFDFREIDFSEPQEETSPQRQFSGSSKTEEKSPRGPSPAVEEKTDAITADIPMQQRAKHDTIEQGTAIKRINAMTANEFEALDGIGPVIAKRIVEERQLNGNFTTPEDLKRVKGIGDKTLSKILKSLQSKKD